MALSTALDGRRSGETWRARLAQRADATESRGLFWRLGLTKDMFLLL